MEPRPLYFVDEADGSVDLVVNMDRADVQALRDLPDVGRFTRTFVLSRLGRRHGASVLALYTQIREEAKAWDKFKSPFPTKTS